MEQGDEDAGARAADWVAERYRAAVDVQAIAVDGKLGEHREHLRGEGLVQLDEIEVVEGELQPGEQLADSGHGPDAHARGVDARRGPPENAREWMQAVFTHGGGARDDHRRTPVGDTGGQSAP